MSALIELTTHSADETRALGERLARLLTPGDCLALRGELGAGKTTLVQGIAWGLGLPRGQYAPSPTYSIALTYPTHPPLHHLDLFRVEGGAAALLGDAYFEPSAIAVIEWPEHAPDWVPAERFEARLTLLEGEARRVVLTATSKIAHRLGPWHAPLAGKP